MLGDLVKYDTLWLLEPDRLRKVPCDRFALTVGVGREYDLVGLCRFRVQFINYLLFFLNDEITGDKSPLDIDDIFIALRQIADVPHRCAHHKILTEVLLDRLSFSW